MTIEQANNYVGTLRAALAVARIECNTAFCLDLSLLIEKAEEHIKTLQDN